MTLSPSVQFHSSALVDSLYCFSRLQFHPRLHLLRFKSTKTVNYSTKLSSTQNSNDKIPPLAKTTNNWIQNWPQTPPKPLHKSAKSVLDYRNSTTSDDEEVVGTSRSTGSSTMERIVEKLKKFGYIDDSEGRKERALPEKGSVEDIFYAEDGVLPDSRGGLTLDLNEEVRFPWEKPSLQLREGGERRKRSKTSVAELTLPEGELRRLRHLAIRMKSKTRIKGAGVTKEIVDLIHAKWRTEEVVRLKCEGPSALNMKRMHEILERKTGGLVVWRSGSSISLYRGVSYETPEPVKNPYHSVQTIDGGSRTNIRYGSSAISTKTSRGAMQYPQESLSAPVEKKQHTESSSEIKYESEMDGLLDSLGPRYTDWPGSGPLPVDADMLRGIVADYKPPFRILPYGVRPYLGYKEGTAIRRLARVLPPHFALGRSRQHQGLAAAMLKLWERSSIAKIALKRGVQLTTSERMAEDIKKLTGGTLLSRNKDYIVFYRGKDFLSPEVTEALLEREIMAKSLQDEEEQARLRASYLVVSNFENAEVTGTTGTLGETLDADARWGNKLDKDHVNKMMQAAEAVRHAKLVRKLERKLSIAERKLSKAERALAKVEESLKPAERTTDPESITEEERFMFRKLGLRMKAFLLLGRRGVFDGTVENMHLHWKYRELVKVIVKAKSFAPVKNVALALEAESGGVLVSVDKISKGFAVIVYRGKDYQRPPNLRPKNLLTKRKALARSIELQRQEALNQHISNLHKSVEKLKSELFQVEDAKEQGNEDLYSTLDSAYSSEDEDTDDESDEAYLETFNTAADLDADGVSEDGDYDSDDDSDYIDEDIDAKEYSDDFRNDREEGLMKPNAEETVSKSSS